jgi:HSP20 family protein
MAKRNEDSTHQSSQPSNQQTTQTVTARRRPTNRDIAFRGGGVSPWALMRRMTEELDRLVHDDDAGARAGARVTGSIGADWVPRIEVARRDKNVLVRVELPGLKADDVDVTIENGVLGISGERTEERRDEDNGIVRTERAYGTFFRAIPLPDGADEDHITATFRDGVLELTIPISESERGRQIHVEGQT